MNKKRKSVCIAALLLWAMLTAGCGKTDRILSESDQAEGEEQKVPDLVITTTSGEKSS